jgi:hypothetical protein
METARQYNQIFIHDSVLDEQIVNMVAGYINSILPRSGYAQRNGV